MRVLITGTDGYIGSQLGRLACERGHEVVGLDAGFYRDGWLYGDQSEAFPTVTRDVRDVQVSDLHGYDAVLHLAELSNDPLGQMDPDLTLAINHRGSVDLADKCKQAGVKRFVYSSSCSVYGVGNNDFKTELSRPNPQTAYAKCKVAVERDLLAMADTGFSPTMLRNATAFGPSPRMRFDIVLNNLSGLAWTTREIRMISDGTPWRPLVHVLDIAAAFLCALEAPREVVHKEIFNVGDNEANYRIRDIARIVAEVFPGCDLTFGQSDGDNRSYRVSFDKLKSYLPGFRCCHDARLGADQLRTVFEQIEMTDKEFHFRAFTRLKQIQHLLQLQHLDSALCWTPKLGGGTLL